MGFIWPPSSVSLFCPSLFRPCLNRLKHYHDESVILCYQVCRHVDLYGMSNWRPGSDLRYHYFSDEAMTSGKADPKQSGRESGSPGGKVSHRSSPLRRSSLDVAASDNDI